MVLPQEPDQQFAEPTRRDFLRDASLTVALLSLPRAWKLAMPPDPRPANAHDAGVALAWFRFALDLVRTTPGFSPPVASRAFGYLGLAMYEALVPGMPGYRSLNGQMAGLSTPMPTSGGSRLHWPTVANAALAAAARQLFFNTSPVNLAALDALEASLNPEQRPGPNVLMADSAGWGREVAAAVMAWASTDGGHQGQLRNFPTDYTPPVGDGLWVPTPAGFQRALQPYWGNNRTFAVSSGAECESGDHPGFSVNPASTFYRDAVEVYEAVNGLTPEQEAIARFWSDDPATTATPPGHSISILNQVTESEGLDLATAAECYLKVGIAVSDAFVTCWNTKYRYNLLRPVTYINSYIDPEWNPVLNTPPFPEYTSGHSVQSGAAFQVMADLFGSDYTFVDHTHDALGMPPRTFDSFSQAADEAAISRLYGGIHYMPAIDLGVQQGRCVGEAVSRLSLKARP